jgi:hypothetical protein
MKTRSKKPATVVYLNMDARPFVAFMNLFGSFLKTLPRPAHAPKLPRESIRTESDPLPACANHVMVRFYPSDALLDFAAALWARNRNRRSLDHP